MDIICVQQPDGSFKSSPFHVRFGKLKLLKSQSKTVTITVNGVESEAVAMLLGQEGEAFFLRQAFEDEARESIENASSYRQRAISPRRVGGGKEKGPKSVASREQDDEDYKNRNYFMSDIDIDKQRKKANNSSPKSAHHAMGLEAVDFDSQDGRSPQKEDFGETEEEQRKGLWRSIFGYFRGPNQTTESKSVKAV